MFLKLKKIAPFLTGVLGMSSSYYIAKNTNNVENLKIESNERIEKLKIESNERIENRKLDLIDKQINNNGIESKDSLIDNINITEFKKELNKKDDESNILFSPLEDGDLNNFELFFNFINNISQEQLIGLTFLLYNIGMLMCIIFILIEIKLLDNINNNVTNNLNKNNKDLNSKESSLFLFLNSKLSYIVLKIKKLLILNLNFNINYLVLIFFFNLGCSMGTSLFLLLLK